MRGASVFVILNIADVCRAATNVFFFFCRVSLSALSFLHSFSCNDMSVNYLWKKKTETYLCSRHNDLVKFLTWQQKTIRKLFVKRFVKNFKFLYNFPGWRFYRWNQMTSAISIHHPYESVIIWIFYVDCLK